MEVAHLTGIRHTVAERRASGSRITNDYGGEAVKEKVLDWLPPGLFTTIV
jgi:hypothetical protein